MAASAESINAPGVASWDGWEVRLPASLRYYADNRLCAADVDGVTCGHPLWRHGGPCLAGDGACGCPGFAPGVAFACEWFEGDLGCMREAVANRRCVKHRRPELPELPPLHAVPPAAP